MSDPRPVAIIQILADKVVQQTSRFMQVKADVAASHAIDKAAGGPQ